MPLLNESEKEEFLRKIRWARFSDEDFKLSEAKISGPASPVGNPVNFCVTVVRRSTGNARTYAAGPGHTWLTAFQRDLDADAFGTP